MKHTLLPAALLLLASCANENSKQLQVEGKLQHADAATIYLEENGAGAPRPVIVDSASLGKDGSFELEAPTGEESMYSLRLSNAEVPVAMFISDSREVKVNGDLRATDVPLTITGSKATDDLQAYDKEVGRYARLQFASAQRLDTLSKNGTPDSVLAPLLQAHQASGAALRNYALKSIRESKSPIFTLYAMGTFQQLASAPAFGVEPLSEEEIKTMITDAGKRFPKHTALAEVQKSVTATPEGGGAPAPGSTAVGAMAPDFTLPDVNGKPVALSSLRGKYVLVDFWASWCRPCRAENPNVVAAFNKFRNKNFTILGVSLDQEKGAWTEAIQKDGLAWAQVSDLKFWDSMVVPLYDIQGIPYNVLLDPSGKIIAANLREDALHQKLAEVLK